MKVPWFCTGWVMAGEIKVGDTPPGASLPSMFPAGAVLSGEDPRHMAVGEIVTACPRSTFSK